MTTSMHTATPWYAPDSTGDTSIRSRARRRAIAHVDFEDAEDGTEFQANIRRIVTCVNACEPLERPETQIPALIKMAEELVGIRLQKRIQRDELIAAMNALIDRANRLDRRLLNFEGFAHDELGEITRARAAIARAMGE